MTINTITSNPSRIKECLRTTIKSPILSKKASWIWGGPGQGKSQIVAQLAREFNYKLFDIRLTTKDSTDLTGLPYLHEETKKTIYYIPEFFPSEKELESEGYKGGIIFLDELSSAEQRIQVAAYELCLDRRVGNYKLPDNVVVIAAGNRIEDRAIAYDLTSAISDRFIHYVINISAQDWLPWAEANNIHRSVLIMIKTKPEFLNGGFSESIENDNKINPSPRSWATVSDVMYEVKEDFVRKAMINGILGTGAAQEFFFVIEELGSLLPMSEYIALGLAEDEKAIQEVLPTTLPALYGLGYSLPAYCKSEDDYIAACFLFNVLGGMNDGENSRGNSCLPYKEIMANSMITLFTQAHAKGGIKKAQAVRRSSAYSVIRKQIGEFTNTRK